MKREFEYSYDGKLLSIWEQCEKCGKHYDAKLFYHGVYGGEHQICSVCNTEQRTYNDGCNDCDHPTPEEFVCRRCYYDDWSLPE